VADLAGGGQNTTAGGRATPCHSLATGLRLCLIFNGKTDPDVANECSEPQDSK
jgi:hypothetical protein